MEHTPQMTAGVVARPWLQRKLREAVNWKMANRPQADARL